MPNKPGLGNQVDGIVRGGKTEKKNTKDKTETPAATGKTAAAGDGKRTGQKRTGKVVLLGVPGYYLDGAAKQLGVSTRAVREYLKGGKLRGQKIGKRWFIAEENLQRFVRGDDQETQV
jgi:excisionase family DNA binding protein